MSTPNLTARNKHFGNGAAGAGAGSGAGGYPSNRGSIDITKEEFSRIEEALKKEEFRKLFLDYCEEIQDPENRKIYEDEIRQLEAERGVDVRFVNPEPGFVVKTSADGSVKCFINIAKSPEVAPPKNEVSVNQENGERGISWSIPMAQSPPRDDLDAHNKMCRVYDVVFHPDALYLGQKNSQFRKCLIDTALDAVEREYKVNLDRANLKFPKLDYKGIARATVIRRLAKNPPAETTEPHPLDDIYPARPTADSDKPKQLPMKSHIQSKPEYATPKYVIKHRRGIDLAEYTQELDAKLNMAIPHELVVEIDLPLLSSANECQLDVTEKSVYLLSDRAGAKYRLKVDLPYSINDKKGTARFDVETRRLSITAPVIPPSSEEQRKMHETVLHLNREDSGVESEGRDESSTDHSPSESPIQEIEQNFAEDEQEDEKIEEDSSANSSVATTTAEEFLENNLPYKLPEKFDCNVLDDTISFVLHVRNVQPESIAKLQTSRNVHVRLTSIGSGYYPTYYAFFVQLPTDTKFEIVSADVEAWENNILLNITLSECGESLQTYFAGLDSTVVKEYSIRNLFKVANDHNIECIESSRNTADSRESDFKIAVDRKKLENIEIEIRPREVHSSDVSTSTTDDKQALVLTQPISAAFTGDDHGSGSSAESGTGAAADAQAAQKKLNRKQRKRQKKQRSLSESAFDDIKSAIQQLEAKEEHPKSTASAGQVNCFKTPNIPAQRKQRSISEGRDRDHVTFSADGSLPFKGILKHCSRYDHPMRRSTNSDSCSSSVEDCSSFSSYNSNGGGILGASLHFSKSFRDIPEEHACASLSESCKKTVRFNDIIQKQIFRLDSSILGQRKKNQKRRNRKQRALQRRVSEGDSADYDEDHKPLTIQHVRQSFIDKGNCSDAIKSIEMNIHDGNGHNDELQQGQNRMKVGKNKKKRLQRQRRESESSDVDGSKGTMMFEIDLE